MSLYACKRCNKVIKEGVDCEHCWRCQEYICGECWEKYGDCGVCVTHSDCVKAVARDIKEIGW